jgi:hypothetical protein
MDADPPLFAVPRPLCDVFAHEGLAPPATAPPWAAEADARDAPTRLRLELYGLPGLGKSTLARAVAREVDRAGGRSLVLPEAVPYAVQVRNIALLDLEPFLDGVNAQAEDLARRVAERAVGASLLVVLRDPAHQQNESYRFVLHALRDPRDAVAGALHALGAAVAEGGWSDAEAEAVGSGLWARHAALRAPPSGPWQLLHVLLTTGDPATDLALSHRRQRNADRDARLVTDSPVVLAGYLATLRFVERATRESAGVSVVTVDPRWAPDRAADAVMRALPLARPSARPPRSAEGA